MKDFRERIMDFRKEMRTQAEIENMLSMLLGFNDGQLQMFKPIFESLGKLNCDPEKFDNVTRKEWYYVLNSLACLIELLGSRMVSVKRRINNVRHRWEVLLEAVINLPEPFRTSPQVLGALELIAMDRRFRFKSDLPIAAIRWKERLGEPKYYGAAIGLLEKYPFLIPVAFDSKVSLSDPDLYRHYYGFWPGLRDMKDDFKRTYLDICVNSPLQDIYALCPLPTWAADDAGKNLWLEERTWPEQLNELERLNRVYKGITVRFATLPELMFLDWSMRLATGESPMEIWSYRSEFPGKPDHCLLYGGVGDYGAMIEIGEPEREARVMPLFIFTRTDKEEK